MVHVVLFLAGKCTSRIYVQSLKVTAEALENIETHMERQMSPFKDVTAKDRIIVYCKHVCNCLNL